MQKSTLEKAIAIQSEIEELEYGLSKLEKVIEKANFMGVVGQAEASSVKHINCYVWLEGDTKRKAIRAVEQIMSERVTELEERLREL